MDIDTIGICVTIIVGIIAIALAIYFGLRGFANSISQKVDETRSSIVLELSGIKDNIVKIGTRVDDIWQIIPAFVQGRTANTVEVELKNFGKTKVWAELAETETRYMIRPEKGKLIAASLDKISKNTGLAKTELEMFSNEVRSMDIGNNTLRVRLPSVDPQVCTKYMSLFLKWLDTEYVRGLQSQITEFEKDIKV